MSGRMQSRIAALLCAILCVLGAACAGTGTSRGERPDGPAWATLKVVSETPVRYATEFSITQYENGYELVYGKFLYLCIVESYAQVGGKVEFASHVAHDPLEECVDGLNMEIVIVVEEVAKTDSCSFTDCLHIESGFLFYSLQIVIRCRQLFPDAIKLA